MAVMQTVEMTQPGSPDVLILGERPIPAPAEREVLIKVAAVGVNGPDLVQRRGHYPPPKGASDLLGLEVAGEIVATGTGVTRWKTGDQVCALTNGGGYAEQVAVLADHCLTIPPGVDLTNAAGVPETYFTVWSNIFFGREPRPGEIFLVQGGAGGIGSTAVQLGRALGLTVFATADGPDDCAYCIELGAHTAIDFRREDFVEIVRAAGGADVTLDIIGGDYVAKHIKASRHDGRIVSIAFNGGSKVEVDLMPMMLKRLTLTGSTLRSRPDAFKAAVAAELERVVWPLFANGALRTVTHAELSFREAAEAHRMMEAAAHRGKILLHP